MDHREFLAAMPREQKQELTRKSDSRGLVALAIHFGAILLIGTLITMKVPLWPLLLIPQGVLIIFLFTTLHETIHRTAFATTWINDAVARLCGFLIIICRPTGSGISISRTTAIPRTRTAIPNSLLRNRKPGASICGIYPAVPIWISHVRTLVNAMQRDGVRTILCHLQGARK